MSDTLSWTAPAGVVWHDHLVVGDRSYPTRNPAPGGLLDSDEYLSGLTHGQRDTMRAVHEAAHAVAALASGAHLHSVRTSVTGSAGLPGHSGPGVVLGRAEVCNLPDGRTFAVFSGAGERAEDLWLRRQGLWTPARAVGVELGAHHDRATVLEHNPHLRFGLGPESYLAVHAVADEFLERHWGAVLAVAGPLMARLHLTADEAAALAGMPNGSPSATCTR